MGWGGSVQGAAGLRLFSGVQKQSHHVYVLTLPERFLCVFLPPFPWSLFVCSFVVLPPLGSLTPPGAAAVTAAATARCCASVLLWRPSPRPRFCWTPAATATRAAAAGHPSRQSAAALTVCAVRWAARCEQRSGLCTTGLVACVANHAHT